MECLNLFVIKTFENISIVELIVSKETKLINNINKKVHDLIFVKNFVKIMIIMSLIKTIFYCF